jgi:hypothetical protein
MVITSDEMSLVIAPLNLGEWFTMWPKKEQWPSIQFYIFINEITIWSSPKISLP